MSNRAVYGYIREAVRVKVKKYDGGNAEFRKFSIDPQITSFEVLQSIIAKAFEIKGVFLISYRVFDDYGQEALLPLLSDWDLDAAILSASDPCLTLQVDIKAAGELPEPSPEPAVDLTQQDVFGTIEISRGQLSEPKPQNRLPGLIMNRMEKTLNIFQKAFNLGEDQVAAAVIEPPRPPLADAEFRTFLDPIGQISQIKDLRTAIYYGGVEPSLRKVVWKHILNVYPEGLSGKERMDYIKKKTYEYESMRNYWRELVQNGCMSEALAYVTSMVRKDVLRTDRHHKFYAGSDDNQNIASLFNILTTYSLNHPSVSYCQGMSDLASPLLVTMGDEAHAYICFCALMTRLKPNFMLDGIMMTVKFQHLTEGLMFYDPEFHAYLKQHQADDLLFCYRWLLLEMKREFAFDDALHMLEVLWSSLQPAPPAKELALFETKFCNQSPPPPISPLLKTPRENPYTKFCALRRQSSSVSLNSLASGRRGRNMSHRQNQSLDESILARQNRLRKQGNVKPFSSLDDNCVAMDKKRAGRFARHGGLSSSTGNLIESNKRNLSKRLAEHSPSLMQLSHNEYSQKENEDNKKVHKGKVVKNLNEFLNFARQEQRSQCISESGVTTPVITVTQTPVDEVGADAVHSDSSSCQASSPSYSSASPNVFDESSPDDSDYYPMTTSMTRELRLELDNLDRKVFGSSCVKQRSTEPEVFIWENPLTTPEEQSEIEIDKKQEEEKEETPNGYPCESAELSNFLTRSAHNLKPANILSTLRSGSHLLRSSARSITLLPPPNEFGCGNPFLMFLCLALLRQHRDQIMTNQLDYNEMAMHFDKMIRKHHVTRVLNEARHMFSVYLKQHSNNSASSSTSSSSSSSKQTLQV